MPFLYEKIIDTLVITTYNETVNGNDKLPLYWKLAEIIEEKIDNGDWKKGKPIPSERDLCKMYSMSRITVRKAVDELVRQGKLDKVQGKGTYVMGTSVVQNLGNVYSFSQEMEKQGKISSTKLVTRKTIEVEGKLARNLGVDDGTEVIYLERLRCAEDAPIMLERSYFPKEKFKFIFDIDLNKEALYRTLEDRYGVVIDRAIERFKACELNSYECKMLNCKMPQYGLLVRRTSYSKESLVCYSIIVSKGDTFEFTVQLAN